MISRANTRCRDRGREALGRRGRAGKKKAKVADKENVDRLQAIESALQHADRLCVAYKVGQGQGPPLAKKPKR